MSERVKNAFYGVTWSAVSKFGSALFKFITIPLLILHFGKEDYGLIGLVISINVYFQLFDLGFGVGTVKFISEWLEKKENRKLNSLFQTSTLIYTIIGIFNGIIFLFLLFYSNKIFNLDESRDTILKNLLLVLSVSTVLVWSTSILDQILISLEKISWLNKLKFFVVLINFLVAILTIHFNFSILQYFVCITLSNLIVIPLKFIKCKNNVPNFNFRPKFNGKVFSKVFKYSSAVFIMGIFQFSAKTLQPIILGIRANLSSVTDYHVMNGIISLMLIISTSFWGILLPIASKAVASENLIIQKKIAYDATKYLSTALTFAIFLFISISENLLVFYVGESFRHLSIWINIWAIALLGGHDMALSSLVLAKSNIKSITYFSAFSSSISIIISWFLASRFQVGGVIIGFSIYTALQISFYYLYYLPRHLPFDTSKVFLFSFIRPVSIGLIPLILVTILFHFSELEGNLLLIILKATLYCALFFPLVLLIYTKAEIKNLYDKIF